MATTRYTTEDAVRLLDDSFEAGIASELESNEESDENTVDSDYEPDIQNTTESFDTPQTNDDHHRVIESISTPGGNESNSENSSETPVSRYSGSRKRLRRTEQWSKVKRKKLRILGKEYETKSGKKARNVDETPCGCKLQCYSRISKDQRINLNKGFWASGDFNVQNTYLCGSVKNSEVARRYSTLGESSRRSYTRKYSVLNEGASVQICKTAFLRIHAVSNGRVTRALKAQLGNSGSPSIDKRGKHEPANKTPKAKEDFVKYHIDSFPRYKSHYSRSDNPNKEYLSHVLSLEKMYSLYSELCEKESKPKVSSWIYRKVFNETFNLSFGSPKSDTCKVCDTMKTTLEGETDPEKKKEIKAQWDLHKAKADRGYQSLKEDSALAKADHNTEMLTFDLEKSLATPLLTTGIVYYKRQLWTYNLGIHNTATEVGCMHMWHEGIASRGPHEIGSCLLEHVKEMASTAKTLILYSDACGGQNRNIYLVCLWMYIVARSDISFTTIDHKFMVSGHSYLPNDRDFGNIEKARKKCEYIYVPSDWERLVRTARKKNPFLVYSMQREDFVSLEPLKEAVINRKFTQSKEKVQWLKMRWLRVQKEKPLQFQYRYSHNDLEEWKTVDLKRRTKGRPPDMGLITLPSLYTTARKIKAAKMKDLLELLAFIPPVYHDFYKQLEGCDEESESEQEESSDSCND